MKKLFMLLLLLIVPFMLVGCGDKDDDDEESGSKKAKTEEKSNKTTKKTESSSIKTITCSGTLSGIGTEVTYSINTKTNKVLVNTMQYTIKNPSTTSEKDICDSYAQAGFKDCSVNFTSNAAVVTVTPVNDVYANLSFDDIESQLEGIGLTCTIK